MTKMTFQFLDVGMGDGTFVIMGEGKDTQLALIDFGVQIRTKFKVGADDATTYLVNTIDEISKKTRELPVPYLDHLFITHPDHDHYNRILPLIGANYPSYFGKDLSIGQLSYGGKRSLYTYSRKRKAGGKGRANLIDDITPFVKNNNVDVLTTGSRSVVDKGQVNPYWKFVKDTIKVYLLSVNYPTIKSTKRNPLSLCLMFEDPNHNKVIFMGDAEQKVENEIIKNFKDAGPTFLNAFALKLGHHASVAGTGPKWLEAVKPKAVFASGDMVWAHPYCLTIDRVVKAGSLGDDKDHWYCCGISHSKKEKEYFNRPSTKQVYLNLWYVVKEKTEQMQLSKDLTISMDQGTTYGVQWAMDFEGSKKPDIYSTEAAVPVKPVGKK